MYYFGCIGRPGHYLWKSDGERMWGEIPDNFPQEWTFEDPYSHKFFVKESVIASNAYGKEGIAKIKHKDGWTCLSFPDRSVDNRPNCVSVFIQQGTYPFNRILEIARREFPSVMNRYNFEIQLEENDA